MQRRFGTDEDLSDQLVAYLDELPGLRAQYERARELEQIPVTLPDGSAVTLTPGGQNVLLKAMIEDFCSRFTKGGLVLYVGDAGKDDPIFEEAQPVGDAPASRGVDWVPDQTGGVTDT